MMESIVSVLPSDWFSSSTWPRFQQTHGKYFWNIMMLTERLEDASIAMSMKMLKLYSLNFCADEIGVFCGFHRRFLFI